MRVLGGKLYSNITESKAVDEDSIFRDFFLGITKAKKESLAKIVLGLEISTRDNKSLITDKVLMYIKECNDSPARIKRMMEGRLESI